MDVISVREQIRGFVAEVAGESDPSKIDPRADLFIEGWLDSFLLMRLVGYVEKSFDIAVPGASIAPQNFATIDSICAFIASRKADR